MGTITAQTAFVITALTAYEETADLILLPENAGSFVLRELIYPGNIFPTLVYEQNPEVTDNFDTIPLNPPQLKMAQAISTNKFVTWPGYDGDRLIKEYWPGGGTRMSATAYFVRQLLDYWLNTPASGYIIWAPKDKTTAQYYIAIEDVAVGGSSIIKLDNLVVRHGYVLGELTLALRILEEVAN